MSKTYDEAGRCKPHSNAPGRNRTMKTETKQCLRIFRIGLARAGARQR